MELVVVEDVLKSLFLFVFLHGLGHMYLFCLKVPDCS